jgi:lysophospholipase L1-like esterase
MNFVPNRRRLLLAGLACHAMAIAACAQGRGGTATEPLARDDGGKPMHEAFLKRAARGGIDLLFLGDSITQGWFDNPVWQRFYGPRRAANFGIGGDRTQHVLWRLDHGEVDGIKPRVVVLMIGTNNIRQNTPDEIYEGVKAIVERLRAKLPESKVLLLGVLPRGVSRLPTKDRESDDVDFRVGLINERISRLGDGKAVTYLDIGPLFLDSDGKIVKELMPDFLHLSTKGYRVWADAMEPTLWTLLEGK